MCTQARSVRRLVSAMLVLTALLVTACGSSDSDPNRNAEQSSANDVSLGAVPDVPTTPPTGIGVSIPLTEKPPEGKTVAWLAANSPSATFFTPGFESATRALGWDLITILFDVVDQTAAATAMQDAINRDVDYIAITGIPTDVFKPQLAAAKSAGIPVVSANAADSPPDPAAGLYAQFGDASTFVPAAESLAHWIIEDSGGNANIGVVSDTSYALLVDMVDGMKAAVDQYCPDACSVTDVPVTFAEVGSGESPSKIVSSLQSHPDIDYLALLVAEFALGLEPALQQAGLESEVDLTGMILQPEVLEELVSGDYAAWVALPIGYQSWLMVDAMARLSVDMELTEEREAASMPTWIVDTPAAAEELIDSGELWQGPEGYEEEFEQLWHVG